jgi:hypothetical protein
MSLNWLRMFNRKRTVRKAILVRRPAVSLIEYDPVRAAYEAECG